MKCLEKILHFSFPRKRATPKRCNLRDAEENAPVTGGWREREKAREESWGPPRGDNHDDGDDAEGGERSSDRFRDRRPQRCA